MYILPYHRECTCKFRLSTDLTSLVNLRASSMGRRSRRAVSWGSENQDLMGIALSGQERRELLLQTPPNISGHKNLENRHPHTKSP